MLITYMRQRRGGKTRLCLASVSVNKLFCCLLGVVLLYWTVRELSLLARYPASAVVLEAEQHTNERKQDWCLADANATIATWDYYPHRPEQIVKEPAAAAEIRLDPETCSGALPLLIKADLSPRPPSDGACDGYNGVLHILHGDAGGASGTIFFQFVVGMLLWADQFNFLPWVHLNNFSQKVYDNELHSQGQGVRFTMMDGAKIGEARDYDDDQNCTFPGKPYLIDRERGLQPKEFSFEGTGVWEHYFEPVSPFQPGDPSCKNKPLVTMEYYQVTFGIHSQSTWSPHPWRYGMPYIVERPDLPIREWLLRQRLHAIRTRERYIRFTPAMEQLAACVHPRPENSLGMHIRHSDKETSDRWNIPVRRFMRYAEAFVNLGGGDIYIATDSALVMEEIQQTWSGFILAHVVYQPGVQGRSYNDTAAFDLGVSTHQTNVEALTDILALSKCTYMIHGLSAMSEAVFYLNPGLMERSVNVEDDQVQNFVEEFVTTILPRGRSK